MAMPRTLYVVWMEGTIILQQFETLAAARSIAKSVAERDPGVEVYVATLTNTFISRLVVDEISGV